MTAVLWGSELSPYHLKVVALCQHAGLAFVQRPDAGGSLENLRLLLRIKMAQRRHRVRRWPTIDALDEYPLVPYLLTEDGAVYMDSSAIAGWLDACPPASAPPLIPGLDDPILAFVCRLLDEAIDEMGLCCVHHHRWVVSHDDNDAGARLAREFRSLVVPPLRSLLAAHFTRRQIRRLPYLFSVAAEAASAPRGKRPAPPQREGFPETHARLNAAWDELVDAATQTLSGQAWLLGDRFSLADAALYGQLGMNLSDPASARRLRQRSPRLHAWLGRIAAGEHVATRGALRLHDDLAPLLDWVERHFLPLMRANAEAYARYLAQGQTRWNESAFDRGEALFDFNWCGAPVRTVVKTFQLRVWRDLCQQARALPRQPQPAIPLSSPVLARIVSACREGAAVGDVV